MKDVKGILELEKDYNRIFTKNIKDDSVIDQSIKIMRNKIRLIEEKELSLESSKEKFKTALAKLEEFRGTK
ncbi:MAG: hypothetical protein JJE18_05365 [Eubacteriaceae bacterium]|nr:hypothetical protein [Eubacteriaceae bacterium]